MKVYVILDTDHLSRPSKFYGVTLSKKKAQEYQRIGYTVEVYPLLSLLLKKHKLHSRPQYTLNLLNKE